jgi:hypothetical protein
VEARWITNRLACAQDIHLGVRAAHLTSGVFIFSLFKNDVTVVCLEEGVNVSSCLEVKGSLLIEEACSHYWIETDFGTPVSERLAA